MKIRLMTAIGLCGALVQSVTAGSFDGKVHMLCATSQLQECYVGQGCQTVNHATSDFPKFLQVQVKDSVVVGLAGGQVTGNSTIDHIEHIDNKLMLGGAEDGSASAHDGVSWSLVIEETNGTLTAAAAGDGVVYIAFGHCTPKN